jgi:DNA-directed RNA polymerase specialized sigma subunit
MLIRIAQECTAIYEAHRERPGFEDRRLAHLAKQLDQRARETFILCHTGFIEQTIARHVHQFDAESPEHALQVLRQAAWTGLDHGIDRYDFDHEAKPLTYMRNWIRAEISETTKREGRLVGLKSAHDLGKRLQALSKQIENEGRPVTIAELAERSGESVERVAEVLPYATGSVVRLDAPVPGYESEETIGALTVDERQDAERSVLDEDTRAKVREAVADIGSPLHRRVIELFYGLADNETVEQKDLFDGVYRDSRNRAFSAEPSVIADRKARGEQVTQRSQKELNKLYRQGKLSFEPGTPEAHELARISSENYDPGQRFERLITYKTGMPPTSGTIQEAKRQAEEKMRSHPALAELAPRYRGENELENSEEARRQVRQALLRLKAISADDESKLKAGRAPSGGKSPLRELAEEHALVDPQSGRLNLAVITPLLGSEAL